MWNTDAMILLLDEDQVGVVPPAGAGVAELFVKADKSLCSVQHLRQTGGTPSIGFPNVRSCQAVLIKMNDGTLIGAHVASAKSEHMLFEKMQEHVQAHGGNAQIQKLYVARNSEVFDMAYGASAKDKAFALGVDKVKMIDTKQLDLQGDGAYVQFSAVAGGCISEGKRNSRMTYPNSDLAGDAAPSLLDRKGRTRLYIPKDATLAPGAKTMHTLTGHTKRI